MIKYAQLKNLDKKDLKELFDLIPQIEDTKSFGEMKGGNRQANGYVEMPYISLTVLVKNFLDLVYKAGIILDFDWTTWDEGRELLKRKDFALLDFETLCKLITAIVRSDRFNEGYLLENFENGNILKILINLKNKIERIRD
jgi:hypothetical protein